jgi:hypothetical protein
VKASGASAHAHAFALAAEGAHLAAQAAAEDAVHKGGGGQLLRRLLLEPQALRGRAKGRPSAAARRCAADRQVVAPGADGGSAAGCLEERAHARQRMQGRGTARRRRARRARRAGATARSRAGQRMHEVLAPGAVQVGA